MPLISVITGDLVNSTLMSKRQRSIFNEQLNGVLDGYTFDFYRGDSFQVFVPDPMRSLRLILQLRCCAKSLDGSFDIRSSIGIGNGKHSIKSLNTATGEAFTLSGRAFDTLSDHPAFLLAIAANEERIEPGFMIVARFADYLIKKITSSQAEVIGKLLQNRTQADAADSLKKSQPTISKQARSAGWSEMNYVLSTFELMVSKL